MIVFAQKRCKSEERYLRRPSLVPVVITWTKFEKFAHRGQIFRRNAGDGVPYGSAENQYRGLLCSISRQSRSPRCRPMTNISALPRLVAMGTLCLSQWRMVSIMLASS